MRKLLDQKPQMIGLSGRCLSISMAYHILDTRGVFELEFSEESTEETSQMCCLIFSSRINKTCGPKAERKLSPYEGLDHVLTDTFNMLSWKSTCVLYENVRSNYCLHLLDIFKVWFNRWFIYLFYKYNLHIIIWPVKHINFSYLLEASL